MSNTATNEERSYQDLLARDSRPVPEIYRTVGETDVGPLEVPTSWFLEREIHDLEVERIWKRTWQMACREEDVPNVGDTWVYDIASLSILIVRVSESEIKAYYNACLHRGRPLRDCPGNVSQLKCPYHGFTWALDGSLRGVPAREQFPTIDSATFRLPEVKVGRWGGFVFINPDPAAESLESHIGKLPEHFRQWPLDERVKVVHIVRILPANWKVVQDAFLEAFHVHTTHPQFLLAFGDKFHRIDTFENFSRGALGAFNPSHYVRWKPNEQQIFNAAVGAWDDEPPMANIPEGTALRPAVADMFRTKMRPIVGSAIDKFTDAEMVDVIWFSLFPNLSPFAGFMSPLTYRFRPYGDDHTRCLMDVMVLAPVPAGERPPAARERWLREDQTFMDAPELGVIAPVLNQDTANLMNIMTGIRNLKRGKMVFAKHHELKLRHFYMLYQKAMGLEVCA